MGQYYMPTCMDKEEKIYSHDYNNGLKLMEHSWVGNNFVNAFILLIAEGTLVDTFKDKKAGRWAHTRCIWAGDYADSEPDRPMPEKELEKLRKEYGDDFAERNKFLNWYGIGKEIETDNKDFNDLNLDNIIIANHTKKEFFSYKTYCRKAKKVDNWAYINPLPLLLCDGNGRGGGDYGGDDEEIGSWARNVISAITVKEFQINKERFGEYKDISGTLAKFKE